MQSQDQQKTAQSRWAPPKKEARSRKKSKQGKNTRYPRSPNSQPTSRNTQTTGGRPDIAVCLCWGRAHMTPQIYATRQQYTQARTLKLARRPWQDCPPAPSRLLMDTIGTSKGSGAARWLPAPTSPLLQGSLLAGEHVTGHGQGKGTDGWQSTRKRQQGATANRALNMPEVETRGGGKDTGCRRGTVTPIFAVPPPPSRS